MHRLMNEFSRRAEFKAAAAALGASLMAGWTDEGVCFANETEKGGNFSGEMEAVLFMVGTVYVCSLSLSLAASRSCSVAGKRAV